MGGRSSSRVKLTATGKLQFSGSISNFARGFANCRTAKVAVPVPAGATGIFLEIQGAPTHGSIMDYPRKSLRFIMSSDTRAEGEVRPLSNSPRFKERWEVMSLEQRKETLHQVNWQCTIPLGAATGRQTLFMPFAAFRPSLFGQEMTGLTLGHQTCYHIGLTVGVLNVGVFGGQADPRYTDGPFAIEVTSISFGRGA